jgi:hypothetical protein
MKGRHPVQEAPELVTDANGVPAPGKFTDALDLASDQDQSTWVTDPDGRRLAALVPVEVLEFYQSALMTEPPRGRHAQPAAAQS